MPAYGPFRSAERLGHGVKVAQKHYATSVHVPIEAETLEQAMGIWPLPSGEWLD